MKTLLVIGDYKDFDTYRKLVKQKKFLKKIKFQTSSYNQLLKNELPDIRGKVIVLLCFPFNYWDMFIEPKDYRGVYGNESFYKKFQDFWKKVDAILKKQYKNLSYINNPKNLAADRDKILTKRLVAKKGVTVPRNIKANNVYKELDRGTKMFIKVRFGSMGKGITYIERDNWKTNFRFRNNKILCKHSDYGWSFINITGKKPYLNQILKQDVIIEEAIDPLLLKDRKFDLRMYVYKDKVLYTYGRTTSKSNVTTNISQGARGEKTSFEKSLPQNQLKKAKAQAIRAIKALGLKMGGVDLMLCSDQKNVMFIEINAFPGLPRARRFNLSRFLYKEIEKDYK